MLRREANVSPGCAESRILIIILFLRLGRLPILVVDLAMSCLLFRFTFRDQGQDRSGIQSSVSYDRSCLRRGFRDSYVCVARKLS